jgi:AcrR family transcriptional regulator
MSQPALDVSRPVRRDVQRNRDALLQAARQAYAGGGVDAPLDGIARLAGVGIATLYRHFPRRADLIDAVLACAVQDHLDIAARALVFADPWDGLVHYLEETTRLEAANRGINDLMCMRIPGTDTCEEAKENLCAALTRLIERAQASGQLRKDVTLQDFSFISWGNSRILDALSADDGEVWRRYLALLLDGFRAEGAHVLPCPPLEAEQVSRAMTRLGERPTFV